MSLVRAQRGFTLIELLVVIAIIGLLSSVVLSSLSVARSKARDAQRKAQAAELMKAMQIYYTTYGRYPCNTSTGCTTGVTQFSSTGFVAQELISANAIQQVPADPAYTNTGSCNATDVGYCICTNGTNSYVLTVNTEDDKGGSDRCYLEVGPNAASFCTGHHGDAAGTGLNIARDSCTGRF